MKKLELYNKIASSKNYEVITEQEALDLANNKLLKWFEFNTDEHGRPTISVTAALKNEEDVSRMYVIE